MKANCGRSGFRTDTRIPTFTNPRSLVAGDAANIYTQRGPE